MSLLNVPNLPSLIGLLVIAAVVVLTVYVIRNWRGHRKSQQRLSDRG